MNLISGNSLDMELYDLENDPREENNVANKYPEIVKKIADIMKKEHSVPEVEAFRISVLGDNQ